MNKSKAQKEASLDDKLEAWTEKRKERFKNLAVLLIFQSVTQHILALQSEVVLFSRACRGDAAALSRAMSKATALAGIVGLIANQIGGKLSDTIGRKPFLALGPAFNIMMNCVLLMNSDSLPLLIAHRILKSTMVTFSGSVMVGAAASDALMQVERPSLAMRQQAAAGVAVTLAPYLESLVLKLSKGNPLSPYRLMVVIEVIQLLTLSLLPETLSSVKRAALGNVFQFFASLNPFRFLKVYMSSNRKLKMLMTVIALQTGTDGKVTSDLVQIWSSNNLKWSANARRDFVACWGAIVTMASATVQPKLLSKLSVFNYTAVGNLFVWFGLTLHGLKESSLCMIGGVPFLLPGVNGGAAHGVRALASQIAINEGYGNGEFSAWLMNMRTLMTSGMTYTLGLWYARCVRRGIYAGTTWWIAGFFGGMLPQLLIMSMPAKDFDPAKS